MIKSLGLVVTSALLLSTAACSFSFGSQGINTGKVEDEIGTKVSSVMAGTDVSVECPEGVSAEQGGTFTCTATAGSQEADFTVTQKDDQGNVSFEPDSAFLDLAKTEVEIAGQLDEQLDGTFEVVCEEPAPDVKVQVAKPGTILQCSFSGSTKDGQTAKDVGLEVEVTDTEGNIEWRTVDG